MSCGCKKKKIEAVVRETVNNTTTNNQTQTTQTTHPNQVEVIIDKIKELSTKK